MCIILVQVAGEIFQVCLLVMGGDKHLGVSADGVLMIFYVREHYLWPKYVESVRG